MRSSRRPGRALAARPAAGLFLIRALRYLAGMTDRDRILFDLCMELRQVPPGILRDLGKRRPPSDELAEKIVAESLIRAGLVRDCPRYSKGR